MVSLQKNYNQRGMGLPVSILLIFITLTSAIWLSERASQGLRHSAFYRKLQTSTSLANTVITDLMRQFSQSYQADHYTSGVLDRNPAFYSNGYSIFSSTSDRVQHYVAFEADGSYGSDIDQPQTHKKIYGVVKFISDLTTFGTMWSDSFTTSADNATYVGKLWANGGWTISGDNCVVNGGPVFVNGNIATSGGGDLVINGNLYRSGSRTGNIVVNGNDYTFIPPLTWPTIDTSYFNTYSNVTVTANTNIRFNSNGTVKVGTVTYSIPSTGLIIYGKNCVLTTSGTVSGHVTVASLRVSGSSGGNIIVDDDIKYATTGSTWTANINDSLAVISTHGQTWTRAGNNQWRYINGCFWIDTGSTSGSEVITLSGGSTNSGLVFNGTRNKAISGTVSKGAAINFDTNLDTYPPPGLPEKPYLVQWEIQ